MGHITPAHAYPTTTLASVGHAAIVAIASLARVLGPVPSVLAAPLPLWPRRMCTGPIELCVCVAAAGRAHTVAAGVAVEVAQRARRMSCQLIPAHPSSFRFGSIASPARCSPNNCPLGRLARMLAMRPVSVGRQGPLLGPGWLSSVLHYRPALIDLLRSGRPALV